MSAVDRAGPARSPSRRSGRPSSTDAFTERAFRAGAERLGARRPRARPGAAPRLRRRPAPRHHRRRDRTARRALDPAARPAGAGRPAPRPLRAALRRRHPRPRRRRPGGRAGQGRRRRPRRRPRQRGPAPRGPRARRADRGAARATTRPRRRAAVAHSAPLWLARMWWEELGAEGARSLLAACNEPAEVAMRVNRRAPTASAMLARRCARPGSRPRAARAAPGRWRRRRRSSSTGRTGEAVPELVAAGELTPQSRGSAAVVEVLDPQPGRARARPLRRARDQDRPDRRADGRSRRGDLGRARPRAGRGSRRPGAAPRPAQRHRDRGRRDGDGAWPPASTGSCSTPPARTSAPSPRARTPAGASRRRRSSAWSRSRSGLLRDAARGCCGRAAPSSTRPARSPAARTRTGSRRCSPRPRPGEVPALALEDLGARAPGLASPLEPRCLQLRPDRDRTTGFFIARLKRDD